MQDSCCGDKKSCGQSAHTLHCVGRFLFAIPLLVFGVFHFLNGQSMVGMLAGWPFALFLVYVSGAGLILGAIALMLNRFARLAAILLAVEIGLFVLTLHLPAMLAGGAGAQMSMMSALKDLALAGGALALAASMTNRGFSAK